MRMVWTWRKIDNAFSTSKKKKKKKKSNTEFRRSLLKRMNQ